MSSNSVENETDNQEKREDLIMDYSIKHPLQNEWSLWYFEKDPSLSWEKSLREIARFDTVEDFWSLYHHIKPASELKLSTDYAVFKKGIKPMWEDPANCNGGRWLINLDRKNRINDIDRYWLDVILCLIGETLEYRNQICGAVVNLRFKTDKIGIWTANASDMKAVLQIGRELKDRLHIKVNIGYELHKSPTDKGSNNKQPAVLYEV